VFEKKDRTAERDMGQGRAEGEKRHSRGVSSSDELGDWGLMMLSAASNGAE
jgi:hypothetical protein